jgi:ActR/RegA family two-component response regulator
MWAKSTTFFEITDTGCGVAKEHLADIFTPFFQVEQLVEREGTGLGLSIVKKEVELMKGSITVASTLGKGTTFKFQIPMTRATEAKDSSGSFPVINELEKGQDWRILLIDNEKVSKELLYDLFTLHNFKVFKSNYDQFALQMAIDKKPHAIYFNLNYPLFGSSSIILKIKEALPDIVLIGITSEAHEKVAEISNKLGCHEVNFKPFDINNVLYKLSKHLPIKYKFHESKPQEELLDQNLVLDWEEIGRIMHSSDLNTLWEHFSNGDLSGIELAAQSIKEKNIKLKDLCRQLIFWAKEFNDSEIGLCLEKVEQIMEKKNV